MADTVGCGKATLTVDEAMMFLHSWDLNQTHIGPGRSWTVGQTRDSKLHPRFHIDFFSSLRIACGDMKRRQERFVCHAICKHTVYQQIYLVSKKAHLGQNWRRLPVPQIHFVKFDVLSENWHDFLGTVVEERTTFMLLYCLLPGVPPENPPTKWILVQDPSARGGELTS